MGRRKDPFWDYAQKLKNGRFLCNYCGEDFSGSATRIKSHMSSIPRRDIRACPKVPDDIRLKAREEIETRKVSHSGQDCYGQLKEDHELGTDTTSGERFESPQAQILESNLPNEKTKFNVKDDDGNYKDWINEMLEKDQALDQLHCEMIQPGLDDDDGNYNDWINEMLEKGKALDQLHSEMIQLGPADDDGNYNDWINEMLEKDPAWDQVQGEMIQHGSADDDGNYNDWINEILERDQALDQLQGETIQHGSADDDRNYNDWINEMLEKDQALDQLHCEMIQLGPADVHAPESDDKDP